MGVRIKNSTEAVAKICEEKCRGVTAPNKGMRGAGSGCYAGAPPATCSPRAGATREAAQQVAQLLVGATATLANLWGFL